MSDTIEQEIDRNLFAFLPRIPTLIANHAGEFALLRNQKIVSLHKDLAAALDAGNAQFADGLYSIQQVTDKPLELGFLSYAGHQG